jgi:hypothetical protein
MNKITIIIGSIFALLLILVGFVYFKGTSTIMEASKNSSNDTVGVEIGIEDLELNPFNGVIGIMGFSLGQPKGFGDNNSFSIDNFIVDVKPLSLFEPVIIVETILIDKPIMNLVIIDDESNFGLIQKKLDEEFGKNQEPTDIKMTINDFYINDTTLKIKSEQYGDHEVTLADIHLVDIGVDEGGIPPSDVMRHIMGVIKPQIGKLLLELGIKTRLSNAFDQEVGERLNEELEKVPDVLKNALDLLKSGKKN